ncbi:MAG TPA: hypothetical protein VMW15_08535 [Terracidiphilus sp.]|jgi:hypothetical protein|nr:hypothetical protein [Terracidiphilus sp.]
MNDSDAALLQLLSDVILPNLKTVQASQSEQITANDHLNEAIEELRLHIRSQFAHISAQLTACRAEIAALHAALEAAQAKAASVVPNSTTRIH